MSINWWWNRNKPEANSSGPLKTGVPKRVLPDHLDLMLDENSFADMMARKEELQAWSLGDEAYAEWQKRNQRQQQEPRKNEP
jgi:hypothetical protein